MSDVTEGMPSFVHDVQDCYQYATERYWRGWLWGFALGVTGAAIVDAAVIILLI
jgi:hypothetical protein